MGIYKFEKDYSTDVIEVGDSVYIDDENIMVLSIIKVDFDTKEVWFNGCPKSSLKSNC
jgi:hypothetical protein